MKTAVNAAVFLLIVAIAASGAQARSTASKDIDLAAFEHGALLDSVSSQYGDGWTARWLMDGRPDSGWSSDGVVAGPFTIVIALPERSRIHALEFDTASADRAERAAKDIDVSVSDTSGAAGFARFATVVLKRREDHQRFNLATPAVGRWIKLSIRSNHGDPRYTELMEFRALGRQLAPSTMSTHLSGTYQSDVYGSFVLQQDGARLSGCYEDAGGTFHGMLEPHAMRLEWEQGGDARGQAIMVLKRDGKSFEGWWSIDGVAGWTADWDLRKVSGEVGSCHGLHPNNATESGVAIQLSTTGRMTLQGIVFDVDGDHLRPPSKHAVDELVLALKAHPGWRVRIEGHTDASGRAVHDLELSQRRAASVEATLVAAGIAADRMTIKGDGQSDSVAANDTDAGRAQNRRVEVVKLATTSP